MNVKASQSVPTFEALQQQQQPQNPRKKPSRSQSQPTLNRKPGGLRTKKTLMKQITHAFSHLSFLYDEMDTASTHSKQTSYSPRKSQTDHEDSLLETGEKADDDDCDLAGSSTIGFTCLAFFKAFIATGILFIPQGYYNGGVIGSTVVNVLCGSLATYCMGLLLETRDVLAAEDGIYPQTYGDIAARVHPAGRTVVQTMIVFSQMGFCCVYLSFIAGISRNSFPIDSMSESTQSVLTMALVAVLAMPLTWIRQLHLFGMTNLVAMIIVFTAIAVILCGSVYHIADQGIHSTVKWGVNENFLMFFGTSVYAFEGIAMVLPIEADMEDPARMKGVMKSCMAAIVVFICAVGAIGYMAFGSEVEDIVLKDLSSLCNGHDWCTSSVKALVGCYCVSVLFTFPLMMVPVVKILEAKVFDGDSENMWPKNGFRVLLVVLCLGLAIAANKSLEHFVSIIGSLACIPLAFMLPAWFHYESVTKLSENSSGRIIDLTILIFGAVAMIASLVAAIASWAGSPILLPV